MVLTNFSEILFDFFAVHSIAYPRPARTKFDRAPIEWVKHHTYFAQRVASTSPMLIIEIHFTREWKAEYIIVIFHRSRRAAIGCWNYEQIWCGTQLCIRRGKFVCRVQLLRHMLWVLSPSAIMEAIRYVRGSNGAQVDTSFRNKHDSNPSHVSLLECLRMTTVKPDFLRHHLRQPRATKTSWSETRFQHSTMKILYHQYKAAKRWKEKITIDWR